MKIVFIENRQKTSFWSGLADVMRGEGHSVSFIVQNPLFTPKGHHSVRLPFPQSSDLNSEHPAELRSVFSEIAESDRNVGYFGGDTRHYHHYWRHISAAVDSLKPDLVIGEPTLFHELMALEVCREKGVLYLHPAATRYPANRFNVFKYDSCDAIGGDTAAPPVGELKELARKIGAAAIAPSYMKTRGGIQQYVHKSRMAFGQAKVLLGQVMGERYNTPSALRKKSLDKRVQKNLLHWGEVAEKYAASGYPSKNILYPLQLQPEANLDVWGRQYRSQVSLIKEVISELPDDFCLLVKTNPKAKYELSNELVALVSEEPRVIPLPHSMAMREAKKYAVGALTVTGTVGYEALFDGYPCYSLSHPVISKHFQAHSAGSIAEAVAKAATGSVARADVENDGLRLLSQLWACSYPGRIGDSVHTPEVFESENLRLVAKNILSAFSRKD